MSNWHKTRLRKMTARQRVLHETLVAEIRKGMELVRRLSEQAEREASLRQQLTNKQAWIDKNDAIFSERLTFYVNTCAQQKAFIAAHVDKAKLTAETELLMRMGLL